MHIGINFYFQFEIIEEWNKQTHLLKKQALQKMVSIFHI